MNFADLTISNTIIDFFIANKISALSFDKVNNLLKETCGICSFFESSLDFLQFIDEFKEFNNNFVAEDRTEYGDFQTNQPLADKIVEKLVARNISPEVLIEPTCGKGNFIIAALTKFNRIKQIIGIEIYKPYVRQTKLNILNFFLEHSQKTIPQIEIYHCSFFDLNFQKLTQIILPENILILGNPPWVTNSKLSSLKSSNLPPKSNFKKQQGIDAITGKGNFDIAEYITLTLLNLFKNANGYMAFLVKNSVIKNLIFEQIKSKIPINHIEKQNINCKKEFHAAVDAALLFCRLNDVPSTTCKEMDFYTSEEITDFGWVDSKYVANINLYKIANRFDGNCPFEWRQGVKHDCTQIMELKKVENQFQNKSGNTFDLENELVFPILKSSDLKNEIACETNRYTIITQKKTGQETSYIKRLYPKTYLYLQNNIEHFNHRKSIIYKDKPAFSIFGIGDYSFKPYKVAISGLYKTFHFTLVLPQNDKPVMLDDTCYFIGFDNLQFALYTLLLLNSKETSSFLKSISFPDAKRMINKDVLMRIDINELAKSVSFSEIGKKMQEFNRLYHLDVSSFHYESYNKLITHKENPQPTLF